MAAELILWTSAGMLVYTYLIYPAYALAAASVNRKRGQKLTESPDQPFRQADGEAGTSAPVPAPPRALASGSSPPFPFTSILMPVHNEEEVLRQKITSLLASDYTPELCEIIIGSDASDDGSDAIIGEYSGTDARIVFFRSEKRSGKAAMLNELAGIAKGEILIITDANVIPSADSIRLLAGEFIKSSTGLCDASVRSSNSEETGITLQENFYARIESALKRAEGEAWGTMTGPYGGFYAVRKSLFEPLPCNMLVDDLYVGLTVLQKGSAAYNVPEAVVIEDTPPDIASQFRRRVRIAAGSFQNLFHFGPFPGRSARASFSFFSHKVLRWCSPLFLVLVFMTTVILSAHSVFYFCLLSIQLIFILLPAIDMMLGLMGITLTPLRFATQFFLMNAALAAGLVKSVRGIKKGTWEPTKRV